MHWDWAFGFALFVAVLGYHQIAHRLDRVIKLLEQIRDDNATWRENTWNRDRR